MSFALIIDSDSNRSAALSSVIKASGLNVRHCSGLGEAVRLMQDAALLLANDNHDAISQLTSLMNLTQDQRPLIAYSNDPQIGKVVKAVKAGASQYLAWPTTPSEILKTVIECWAERAPNASAPRSQTKGGYFRGERGGLTTRELQVLQASAQGMTAREIGLKLDLSPRTVEVHRGRILAKFGAPNMVAAITAARAAGLEF